LVDGVDDVHAYAAGRTRVVPAKIVVLYAHGVARTRIAEDRVMADGIYWGCRREKEVSTEV
jgi:hypothetical protein